MKKILSIIIPTYNMEKYLDKCLTSLIVSDEKKMLLDVLIIIDGSKDKSSEIAHNYASKYPEIFRVIDKENGNYGSCINRGLTEATGKYVKVLDADDWFETDALHDFIIYLEKCKAECILTDFVQVSESGKIIYNKKLNLGKELHYLHELPDNTISRLWMHQVTYLTDNIRQIQYKQTEGISYTDQEWLFLPFSTCNTWQYCPIVLYNYLVGRAGQTVDDVVWEKNFWMELKGMYVMLDEMNNLYSQCTDDGKRYLKCRLNKRALSIYDAYYLKFKSDSNLEGLRQLDNTLDSNYPEIISYIESKKWLKVIPFYYIKRFRKAFKRNKLVLLTHKIKSFFV